LLIIGEPILETVTAKDGAAATENALTGSNKRLIFSTFIAAMNEDYPLDAFGNLPYMLLNAAFNLRAVKYGHKYPFL
jgi:hypothetical protein